MSNQQLLSSPPTEGILLIDKPAGKTSFYLVHILRKKLGVKKIGHCGTLDPFATGVMVMVVGKIYTRKSQELSADDKVYEATLLLGQSTDSYDLDGQVTNESAHIPTLSDVENALEDFQGDVMQTPPMFSAKKVKGKKLCDLARKGIEVERKPCPVRFKTTLIDYTYPHIKLHIECSKGTYIRSIAHDLGMQLGCYAHLVALRRVKSGPFSIENCIDVDTLLQPEFAPPLCP